MFSKTGGEKASASPPLSRTSEPWSLGSRFAFWFAIASLFLAFLTLVLLKSFHAQGLDRIMDAHIAEKLHSIENLVKRSDFDGLKSEVLESKNTKFGRPVLLRFIEEDSKTDLETPGMKEILPPKIFEQRADLFSIYNLATDYKLDEDTLFRIALYRFSLSGKKFTIHAAINENEELAISESIGWKITLVLFLSFLVGGLAGYFISKRGIEPISRISATTELVNSLALGSRIPTSGLPLELYDLATKINSMLSRLEESFNRLSGFSSDIAHELRTPAHNLRGLVEVALTGDFDGKKTKEMLQPCLEECNRLSKLIDNLLFLAKVENPQTQLQKSSFDAKKELTILVDYYEAAAGESQIDFSLDAEENLLFLSERILFQRALGNLIENALKFSSRGGKIFLNARRQDSFAEFKVRDTGKGISPDQIPYIFDRFYRADFARGTSANGSKPGVEKIIPSGEQSNTVTGTGLGLSIVKGIVSLHGGSITVDSSSNSGTTFTILIPLA